MGTRKKKKEKKNPYRINSPTLIEQSLCRKIQWREGKRRALLGKLWGLRRRAAKKAWLHLHQNRTAQLMLLKLRVGFFSLFFFFFFQLKAKEKLVIKAAVSLDRVERESLQLKKKIIAKNSQGK